MSRKGENIYKRKDGRWEGRYKIGVERILDSSQITIEDDAQYGDED